MVGVGQAPAERIVSLLPSATEILHFVGAGERVVACTHECDFPVGVGERLPHVTRSLLPPNLTAAEIDAAVAKSMASDAHTIYALESDRLRDLQPQVIVTQKLCDVCAVPERNVQAFACSLPRECRVVSADPTNLVELFDSIRTVGEAVGATGTAAAIDNLRNRLARLQDLTAGLSRPRVAVLEWPDPPYAPGHWVPDQIEAAGGVCALGESGQKSRRITWSDIAAAKPDVLICAFCGFDLNGNEERLGEIMDSDEWKSVAKSTAVYASDASAFFSRPGPRLIDGAELLAYVLHGERAPKLRKPSKGQFSRLQEGTWVDLSSSLTQ